MTRIYAQHGSAEFNRWMDDLCDRIATATREALGDNLVALLLGGGYGKGEGGVACRDGKEVAYNDLDFTLIVANKKTVRPAFLHELSRPFAVESGIHVDYSRPLTPNDVRHWPHWLMWQDLLNGHMVLDGSESILGDLAPDSLRDPLPAIEATRLLLNRGAGLLWSMRVLKGVEPEPDWGFIQRNYYKCLQALGDALLISYGRYRSPYTGRDEHYLALERDQPEVAAFGLGQLYRRSIEFKFRPSTTEPVDEKLDNMAELACRWNEVFLHVERRRTGQSWPNLGSYSAWTGLREPAEHGLSKLPRNLLQNARRGKTSWRYPREELYQQLPTLLQQAERDGSQWAAVTNDFLDTWNRFN